MGTAPRIVVIGASAGGVEAIATLAAALPWLLNQRGPLPACHPLDGGSSRPGHIFVALPDHHLLVEPGRVRLARGPRENWARPAVDPLFRSAARTYGPDVVGVVLTGGLNDGTAGLFEVKRRGGLAVVQDPDDAVSPGMPRSALRHVAVDYCLALKDIPAVLAELVVGSQSGAIAVAKEGVTR